MQSLAESVQVQAETPLIETTTSSVGGVVDTTRIESMPLNGRQFANLAATIPGVGLGFHSDPTKSTQYAPQIGGGNGRNLNFQIDGGDNNDDTVGGQLQAFPLEAIDQFSVITSRYKAEYGRSNGGVLNVVTKSGTNNNHGSWFTLLRDDAMNVRTETERRNNRDKQDYRRWQYGGSFGGPIIKNKLQYFAALRADPAGHVPVGLVRRPVPDRRRRLCHAGARNAVHVEGERDHQPEQLSLDALRPQRELAAVRRRASAGAQRLGRQQEQVQLDQRQLQHGARRHGAERVRVPVRRLRQQHPAEEQRDAPDVPERRADRPEPEHAADDAAEEVAVPRRLLLDEVGHARHQPRLQGGRQLDSRADAVHHVQHRQGHRPVRASGQHAQRSDRDHHAERRRRAREHPARSVRVLHPGRLARQLEADDQRRPALRRRRRFPDRPVGQPELREDAGRGPRRPARGHQGPRELRSGSEGRHQQLAATHRLRLRPPG